MPPSQKQTEKRYHQILEDKWGLTFNHLFNFANVPLGRFKQWLVHTGNYENYLRKLVISLKLENLSSHTKKMLTITDEAVNF
jgi:hypothetical protein